MRAGQDDIGVRQLRGRERAGGDRDAAHVVGAAFDFHAGLKRQAPDSLQRLGLEWAFRLAQEPRRLWRRYLRYNPRFVLGFGRQYLRHLRTRRA